MNPLQKKNQYVADPVPATLKKDKIYSKLPIWVKTGGDKWYKIFGWA